MDDQPLSTLPNLGPQSSRWLAEVGIRSVAELRDCGVGEALRRLLAAGHRPSINLAYAIHAGLAGRHWQDLDRDERSALVLLMDGLRSAARELPAEPLPRCPWCGSDPLRFRQVSCDRYATTPSTGSLSLSSLSKLVTNASVVSNNPAILPAFVNAVRTTLTGSMTPALYISTYCPECAL